MADTTEQVLSMDYTDNFSIKEFTMDIIAPKYFEGFSVSSLAVGQQGFVTEQISNFTEDSFNTMATLQKEFFPHTAVIPEDIYSHAAVFQLDNSFATASSCGFLLAVKEDDIIEHGTLVNKIVNFKIDSDTKIIVEDKVYTLDYDILITAQKQLGKYIYAAKYIVSYDNSISTITDPYIRIRNVGGYLGMYITARQAERTTVYENIIDNSKINFPVIDISFDDQLAGFDVFYKAPTDTDYTQLKKRVFNTTPLKIPFCYYRVKDEYTLSLSFTSKETYFQPEFNSELKIYMYTTTGADGDFDEYTGSNVVVIPSSEKYSYNELVNFFAQPLTGSQGGQDVLSIDALQSLAVEGYSTAKAITTEEDLKTYFNNYKYRYNNEIMFIKKRDDVAERLFSAFLLMKKEDYIYSTNTCFIDALSEEFDNVEENRLFIKPGHLFKYDPSSRDTLKIIPNLMVYDPDLTSIANLDFVYTNPFLICVTKKPNLVGFYMTIVNQISVLDFVEINEASFIQFVTNKLNVVRNLDNSGKIKLSLNVIPSSTIEEDIVPNLNTKNNLLRIMLTFVEDNGESGFIELLPTEKSSDGTITFVGYIETDDYITSSNRFRCLNATAFDGSADNLFIKMTGAVLNIYTLYRTEGSSNNFEILDPSIAGFMVTNKYSTTTDPITFIRPMNMMRSTVTFSQFRDASEVDHLDVKLASVPFVKYDLVFNQSLFSYFIKTLTDQYVYLSQVLSVIRNTSHIDLKFYNTYGKSKNFIAGDGTQILDKVNMSISFKVHPFTGVDPIVLRNNMKNYIKPYIEKINSKGSNSIYISNLIRSLETTFSGIEYLKFLGINAYTTDVQTIRNVTVDLNLLSKEERRNYVPEMLVVNVDDIHISTYE